MISGTQLHSPSLPASTAERESATAKNGKEAPSKTILYLYREIMPYNIPVFRNLVERGYSIVVVQDTSRKKTPFVPPEMEGVHYFRLNQFEPGQFGDFALAQKPVLVFIVDRTVPQYNKAGSLLRKALDIPVIFGVDTQWKGGRQWANVLTAGFRHQRYYTHALVAGARQFVYAHRLGFSYDRILMPLYSADTQKFLQAKIDPESFRGPLNFLFVGRFVPVKGLDVLIDAWEGVRDKRGATLTLVGQGPLKDQLPRAADIVVRDFMDQDALVGLAEESACFILPSVFEPWALVIHEFAAAGLPLIATHTCGATVPFLINNYNGYAVPPRDAGALARAMQKVIHASPDTLHRFGNRSRSLSKKISPESVTSALLSVLND